MVSASRPLRATAADQSLLVGRGDDLVQIRRAITAGLNVLVDSAPGGGRTSVVNAMAFDSTAVTVVGAGGADVTDLLARCVSALSSRRAVASNLGDLVDQFVDYLDSGGDDLQRRRGESGGPRLIILDDAEPASLFLLLQQVRDVLWDPRVVWLVTTRTSERNVVLRPPADAFFDVRVQLAPLSSEDASKLLAARDRDFTDHHQAIVDAIGGNPRALVRALQTLQTGQTSHELTWASRRHRGQLDQLSNPAQALVAALDALGPSSASDERLLRTLGWTRARVSQVLTELRSNDLVEQSELSQGLGRPRKVWRLRTPAEWATDRGVA